MSGFVSAPDSISLQEFYDQARAQFPREARITELEILNRRKTAQIAELTQEQPNATAHPEQAADAPPAQEGPPDDGDQ